MTKQSAPFAGYKGRHCPQRLSALVRGTAESPHVLYRPLCYDELLLRQRGEPLPSGSTVYRHRPTLAERRDDVVITVLVLVLWLLLSLTADRPRRPRLWGETWSARETRTQHTPAALEAAAARRVAPLDVLDVDDVEPADDVPVEVIPAPDPLDGTLAEEELTAPAVIGDALGALPDGPETRSGMTGVFTALTPEVLAAVDAEYAKAGAR